MITLTDDAKEILQCIMSCEIALFECLFSPNRAVVPISNIVYLKKWTKYRVRKALRELRNLDLIEYTSQGCPAIMSYGAESEPELIDDARPPINGYALTEEAFDTPIWKELYAEWVKGVEEWANDWRKRCNYEERKTEEE